jgi:hypothetical protein
VNKYVSCFFLFFWGGQSKQVFAEFLNGFDVGGEKDGMVTPQEWENYYRSGV